MYSMVPREGPSLRASLLSYVKRPDNGFLYKDSGRTNEVVQCQVLCSLLEKKHSENGRFSGGPAYCSLRGYMPMVMVLNKSEAEFPRKEKCFLDIKRK